MNDETVYQLCKQAVSQVMLLLLLVIVYFLTQTLPKYFFFFNRPEQVQMWSVQVI